VDIIGFQRECTVLLTILYVRDLARARAFYDTLFGLESGLEMVVTVDVPVYREYCINPGARLGLMLQSNTRHFLGDELGGKQPTDGCPRGEIYLQLADLPAVIARLERSGATCTSPLAKRGWGDEAAYYLDPDGYVVVVARPV
jgi:catechol 2,3-dioxygenase-like lactoylglutathione lyase family enzyme